MRRRIKPSLVTIVGTAYLTLLEYLAAFPESIILACDVQSELDALRIRPISSRHVVTIPFGASDSLQSIVIDHGTPQQVAAAMALPRVSMSNGCSQLPVVGALAMTHVLKRSQFRQLLRHQILPSLHAWAGGELSVLEHLHFQGLSGGSGSLGGLELVRELCSEVNSSWGIPLRSKLHLIGAVSYQGPAFLRTRENAGCCIADVVDLAKSVGLINEVLVYLHELPPVGINKALRDAFAIEHFQAYCAPNVAEHVGRTAPNFAPAGPLGHVTLVQTSHFRSINKSIVAANVASSYLPIINSVMSVQADLGLVNHLDFRPKAVTRTRESLERVLERVLEMTPHDVLMAVAQPRAQIEYFLQVHLIDGRALDLTNVSETFCQPIPSSVDCEKRLRLLRTCKEAAEVEMEDAQLQATYAYESLEEATSGASQAIADIQGTSFTSWFRSTATKIDRAESRFLQLRTASDHVAECQAKVTCLQQTIGALSLEIASLEDRLGKISSMLASCLPRGDAGLSLALIEAQPD